MYCLQTSSHCAHTPASPLALDIDETLPFQPCVDKTRDCGDVAAISPPYLDATGAGVIITISQAIVTPVSYGSGTTAWHIVGVVGGDLKLSHLKQLLHQSEVDCQERNGFTCILMDLAGSLAFSQSYIVPARFRFLQECQLKLKLLQGANKSPAGRHFNFILKDSFIRRGVP